MSTQDDPFGLLLLESVDEGISVTLGDGPLTATLHALDEIFHIKRKEIPYRMDEFQDAIKKMFCRGSPVIMRLIARILCGKVGIAYSRTDGWDLKMYVDYCRRNWAKMELEAHQR